MTSNHALLERVRKLLAKADGPRRDRAGGRGIYC